MDSKKMKRLKQYAQENDYEQARRFRDELSDSQVSIRIPSSLKEQLKIIAGVKKIPYQRYIKSIIIDAVAKEKIS